MIYLIETTYYNKDTEEVLDLLKIGYTKDIDSRVDSYYLHNPECKLLDIREGDTELESYFHSLYNKYSYPKRREWFYYSQEIVDNFQKISLGDKYLIDKDEYIIGFREYLKSEVPGIQELKSKYLEDILKEIEELSKKEGLEELYNPEFHRSLTLGIWEKEYNSEISYIDSYDFEELFKDYPDKIDIRENPWKNEATFYYRSTCDYRKISQEEFDKELERKKKSTNNLLRSFESAPDDAKHDLAERYQTLARTQNYKDDYIAVNEHQRSNLVPVLNNLVLVNEIRAFKIQQIDYKDRFTVFSTIYNTLSPDDIVNQEVSRFLEQYQKFGTFKSKLKYLCEYSFNDAMTNIILDQIGEHDNIKSYYLALGPEKLRALGYNKTYIEKELGIVTFSQELLESNIYSEFKVGDKITLADIKSRLEVLYKSINYDATPKAKDLENYFNVKESSARVEIDGVKKVVKIYNIISRKEVC